MKNLKRALAVVIALTMVMSTVAFAGVFSDVEDNAAYAEAVELGVALKLFTGYEDGSFKPSGDITRAEFAAVVVRMLGMESSAEGAKGTTKFTDVPSTHWASGYVNIASSNKIVNGYGDGKFGPEDNVTYEQAVKMLVVALGYEPAAAGNYPVGYLTIAQQRGITTGVRGTNGVAANRGQVALMVFNALDVPMMEQTGFGTYIDYVVNDGSGDTYRKTVLTEKLGVVKLRVFVEKSYEFESTRKDNLVKVTVRNAFSSKYSDVDYDDDRIFAKDKSVDVNSGNTNLKTFVGSQVNLYMAYDEVSDDDPVALYAKRYTSGTDELVVKSDNIDEITIDTNDVLTISYYETDTSTKTSKITIKDNSNVYVNGYSIKNPSVRGQISGVYGTITFTRENATSEEDYDNVFITKYINMVVDEVNVSTGRVTGKYGVSQIIFKESNTDNTATLVDADGQSLEWSSLKENDVLSIMQVTTGMGSSRNVNYCTYVGKSVTGRVTEISDDGNDTLYNVGGNDYKIDTTTLNSSLNLDDEGTFYLDILGRIAYFDKSKGASSNYAVVLEASNDNSSLDNSVKVKLFTYEGEVVIFDLMNKVSVEYNTTNGYRAESKDSKDLIDTKPADADSTKDAFVLASNRVITFNVNSQGKIHRISFPDTSKDDDNLYVYESGSASFDSDKKSLFINSRRVYLNDETTIMKAPEVTYSSNKYNYDTDNYEMVALSALTDDFNWSDVTVYDVDKNTRDVKLVIIKDTNFSITGFANGLAMVISKSSAKNTSGTTVDKATVLQNFAKNDFKSTDILASENLQTLNVKNADLITTSINGRGEVIGFRTLAEVETKTSGTGTSAITWREVSIDEDTLKYFNEDTNDNNKTTIYYGNVTSRNSNRITVVDGTDEDDFIIPTKANVYVYDESGNTNAKRVSAPDDRFNVFSTDRTGNLFDMNGDALSRVYVIIREYDGDIADVIFYLFKSNIPL